MPDLAMLDYFYGDEAEQFTFYRIPKVLFTDPSYRRISSDAKILYGLMLDRMGLSVRNGWLDEYNRVFIFFTLEDALEYLCCGHTKAVSLFGELDKAGLIERKKQGQGKPTKIYVKNFVRNAEVLTSEKRKSKVPQSGSQDFQKTASNNTEIKDTELSDTEPSIHPARGLPEDKSPAADAMDTMRVYRQIIMENIEYDITRRQLGYDADILDEIVDIMVDTVCSTKPMIRIKPSKKAVKAIVSNISDTILRRGKAWQQDVLIMKLNEQIRGWTNYHQSVCASDAFAHLDYVLYELLWRWAKRRHPKKNKWWISTRYWHRVGNRNWVFSTENKALIRVDSIAIVRHTKIKATANPFLNVAYFQKRKFDKGMHRLTGKFKTIWKNQNGLCYHCGMPMDVTEEREIFYLAPKAKTGVKDVRNMRYVHCSCQRIYAENRLKK